METGNFKWKEEIDFFSFEIEDYENEKEFHQLEADVKSGEIEAVRLERTFSDDHQLCASIDLAYKNNNQYNVTLMWVGHSGITAITKATEGSFEKLNELLKCELYIVD